MIGDFKAIGVLRLKFGYTVAGPGGALLNFQNDSGSGLMPGIGGTYRLAEHFTLRSELERHFKVGKEDTTGQGDIDLLSIALQYHF